MTVLLDGPVADVNEGDWHRRLTDQQLAESVAWLALHGFDARAMDGRSRYVFRVELDVVDCALLRIWWLTLDEIYDLPAEACDDVRPYAHVSEIAQRAPLPNWWQP